MSSTKHKFATSHPLRLNPGELQVWRAQESDIPSRLDESFDLISPDERSRAEAFRFERDRRRFVFCRGLLRRLIGSYVGRAPGEIVFEYGRYGKPFLSPGSTPIQFNVSHTTGRFLFAFSIGLPVGIDIEATDQTRDWDVMARHFLHPNEWRWIQMQPDAARVRSAYALWTCKEAVLKALGDGVGGGLESFEVGLPDDPMREAEVRFDDGSGKEVWLRPLDEGPGFAAAVATLGKPGEVRMVDWKSGGQE